MRTAIVTLVLLFTISASEATPIRALYGNQVLVKTSLRPARSSNGGYVFRFPRSERFSPNVNILRQPWFSGIRGYAEFSKAQFRNLGVRVNSERFDFGYSWTVQYDAIIGRPLRFRAVAVQSSRGIFLITTTATPRQWRNRPLMRAMYVLEGNVGVIP